MTLNLTAADIGKKFRRRDGEVVIIQRHDISIIPVQANGIWYYRDGLEITNHSEFDLIERVEEPVMGECVTNQTPDVDVPSFPTKPKAFYVVWSPEKGKPTKKHETLESAQTECVRLAKENVCDFYILKALSVTSRGEPKTEELV